MGDDREISAILVQGIWRRLPEDIHLTPDDLKRNDTLIIDTAGGSLHIKTGAIGAFIVGSRPVLVQQL